MSKLAEEFGFGSKEELSRDTNAAKDHRDLQKCTTSLLLFNRFAKYTPIIIYSALKMQNDEEFSAYKVDPKPQPKIFATDYSGQRLREQIAAVAGSFR